MPPSWFLLDARDRRASIGLIARRSVAHKSRGRRGTLLGFADTERGLLVNKGQARGDGAAERRRAMATVLHGARTDEEIQRDVLNELKFEPRVQPNEIGVAV